tara:strand:+ start:54 stop:1163 length:1110 start_codon:yes stop_codon:yes gene_type:complete
LKYLSVCSGIEAATVAFKPLGWEPIGFSEIKGFPSAVLKHHYSETPNFGDMSDYESWNFRRPGPESDEFLLCGGTPCQSFSVSGLRKGLSDERGNLTLTFVKLADHFNPDWIIWENVPGILSSKDNAFGCFLAGLCGESEPYVPVRKWTKSGVVSGPKRTVAWRVQDAQYHGVAQRRRRVFVVAVPGTDNWECAQALFPVGEGMFWDSPKSRETAKETPGDAGKSTQSSGFKPLISFKSNMGSHGGEQKDLSPPLMKNQENAVAFTVSKNSNGYAWEKEHSPSIDTTGGSNVNQQYGVRQNMMVRRLMPEECELLQGFPMGYTRISWRNKDPKDCPDGPRYKALGNSMAVPCMRFIGERIQMIKDQHGR